MRFAGMVKTSTVDYPKKLVTTVFTAGCNFRCEYCHNSDLICMKEEDATISKEEVMEHLEKRKNVIDGICITGGEPSLYGEKLILFLDEIKSTLGKDFLIKIDTNGSMPEFIKKISNKVDFIAMDIKGIDYGKFSGIDIEKIKESLEAIKELKEYELRITLYPKYIKSEDMNEIGILVKGHKKVVLQQFNNSKVFAVEAGQTIPYKEEEILKMKAILEKYVEKVEIR